MKLNLFGYTFSIEKNPTTVEKVKMIVIQRLGHRPSMKDRIPAIRILREYSVSALLINGGLVPTEEIVTHNGRKYVGLGFAKAWLEYHFFGIKDFRRACFSK